MSDFSSSASLREAFASCCNRLLDPLALQHGLVRRQCVPPPAAPNFECLESRSYVGEGLELQVHFVRALPARHSFMTSGFALDGPPLPGAPDRHFVLPETALAGRLGLERTARSKLPFSPSVEELEETVARAAEALDPLLARAEDVRSVLRAQEAALLGARHRLVARGLASTRPPGKSSIAVNYRPTREDHVAMTKRYCETGTAFITLARAARRRFLTIGVPVMVLLTTCLVTTVLTLRNVAPRDAVLAAGAVGAFFGLVWAFLGAFLNTFLVRIRAREIRAARKVAPGVFDRPHLLTVGDGGLTITRGGDISAIAWRGVIGISETPEHVVIDLAGRTPILVPLRVFETPEQGREFAQRLRDLRDVATVEQPVVPGTTPKLAPGRLA